MGVFQRATRWAVLAFAVASSAMADDHWPRFRGPAGTGVIEQGRIPARWSATENVAWKIDVAGRGWSSPVIWNDRVFLTTVVNTGETPEAKKGLYFGGEQSKPPASEHHWKVLCYHLEDGRLLWERTAHSGVPASTLHVKNTYASETPVTDGERVYALFGNLGIYCYDFEGTLLWSKPIEPRKTRYGWGTAASPALHGNRLYLVNDNEEQSYVQALDARTGSELWRVERNEKSNWASPFVWQHEERTELVTPGSGRVRSYDLDGRLLWEFQGMSSITIATPFTAEGLLFVSAGYVLDPNKPLYAIKPGATGDISLTSGETSNKSIAWCQKNAAPYNPSTLAYRGRIYVLYDMGLMAAYDLQTGKTVFGEGNAKRRIPNGRAFTASPWAGDGKIFCINEDGETFVFAAGDEFKLLHTNRLAEDDMAMATPAFARDRLLVRTLSRLYCIRQPE